MCYSIYSLFSVGLYMSIDSDILFGLFGFPPLVFVWDKKKIELSKSILLFLTIYCRPIFDSSFIFSPCQNKNVTESFSSAVPGYID